MDSSGSEDTAERCRRCGRPATIRGFCTDCARQVAEELKRAMAEPAASKGGTFAQRATAQRSGILVTPPRAAAASPQTNPAAGKASAGKATAGSAPAGNPSAYVGKYLYQGRFTCPVCDSDFQSLKVSFTRLRPKERHTDFYVEYHDCEPEIYYITVCRFCGYAAPNFAYAELTPMEKKALAQLAVTRYDGRDFCSERSVADAIECSVRAESFAQNRRSPHGLWGTILLHRAWLLRSQRKEDEEKAALAGAAEHLKIAYENESRLPGTMTKQAFAYLIGEICRRLGDIDGALRWYGEALKVPATATQPAVLRLARRQWQQAREARGLGGAGGVDGTDGS